MDTSCVILNSKGEVFYMGEDALNIRRERSFKNTERWDYNCFGYAFDTYNWAVPFPVYGFLDFLCDIQDGWAEEECDYCEENGIDATDYINLIRDEWDNELYNIFKDDETRIEDTMEEVFNCHNYAHNIAIKIAIDHILATFKDTRRIHGFDELKDDEYGIAFAVSNKDFHFAKYYDGELSHKRGGFEVEIIENLDEAFVKYPSKRFFFAKKKGV